jgi:hypothetical protein
MPAPDTVTEAVEFLTSEGYRDDLQLDAKGVRCDRAGGVVPVESAVVDYTFRFEGPSDPADEAIVLGVRFPDLGIKGVLVSGFGPDADPEAIETLNALTRR